MLSKLKKTLISLILIVLCCMSIPLNTNFAAQLNVQQTDLTYSGLTVKVSSSKKIKKLYIYVRNNVSGQQSSTFKLFYIYDEPDFNEKSFFISRKRFYKTGTTEFKFVAIDEDNVKTEENLTIDKLPSPPVVSPKPSPTTSTAPNPTQSTQPNPSESPKPSPTASTVPSPTESSKPSPTESTKPTPTESSKPNPSESPKPSPTASTAPSPSSSPKPTPEKSDSAKKIEKKIVDAKLPAGDKVYFLDVQDNDKASDCILIQSNGHWGMIDTARDGAGGVYMTGRIIAYLEALNIKELDFILITHAHGDHTGGYSKISKSVKVDNLYIKKRPKDCNEKIYKQYENIYNRAKQVGTKVNFIGDKNKNITLGNFKFTLYNRDDIIGKKQTINENANSVVAYAKVNGRSILFSGDIGNYAGTSQTAEIEKKIYERVEKNHGKVDIYKAAHHGYYYKNEDGKKVEHNNIPADIATIQPKYTVITNRKKHPRIQETRTNLVQNARAGYKNEKNIYFTAGGTIILNIAPTTKEITFNKLEKDDGIK